MTIRAFQPADAEAVSGLIIRTLRHSNGRDYPPENLEAVIARQTPEALTARADWTHFYVAEEAGALIGCGAIGPYWGSETESSLFSFFVAPEWQGRGVGRAIMEALEGDEFFLRASRVEIPASITALGFYQKMGYGFKNGHDRPDEELLYRLEKVRCKGPSALALCVKPMETDAEKRGKGYVHWKAWHEAYPGLVSQDDLDKLRLETCIQWAFRFSEGIWVAKDGDRVVGFGGFGDRGDEAPDCGEIFALYVLKEYYGTGVAQALMETGLAQLASYPRLCLWVLKDNARAIRFYQKFGFRPDGAETFSKRIDAPELRMLRENRPN